MPNSISVKFHQVWSIFIFDPFGPLFLGNGRRYLKSVSLFQICNFISNKMKQTASKYDKKNKHSACKHPNLPLLAPNYETGGTTISKLNNKLPFVSRNIMLKLYNDQSSITNVIQQRINIAYSMQSSKYLVRY